MNLLSFARRAPEAPDASQPAVAASAPAMALPWTDTRGVRQAGAEAAMSHMALDEVRRPYAELFSYATSLQEERFDREVAVRMDDERRLEGDVARHETARGDLQARRDELSARIQQHVHAEADQRAAAEGVLRLIRARQLDIETDCERQRDAWQRERRDEALRHRLSMAGARAAMAAESRRENGPMLDEAATDRRRQLAHLDARLEDVRSRTHQLQQRGLTGLVAGFLIAAAIVAYVGTGMLLWRPGLLVQVFTSPLQQPLSTFSVTLLYGALTSSAALLFWLFVVHPSMTGEPSPWSTRVFYGAALAAPSAALSTVALLPTWASGLAVALIGVPVVATAGLVHGLFLAGLLARERALARQRASLRQELERLTRLPTPEAYVEDAPTAAAEAASAGGRVEPGDLLGVPQDMVLALNAARAAQAVAAAGRTDAERERAEVDARLAEVAREVGSSRDALTRATAARIETLARRAEVMLDLAAGYRRAMLELGKAYQMTRMAMETR